ncbi:TIGR00341 family protein [Haloferacaceae archaeon DSL9]
MRLVEVMIPAGKRQTVIETLDDAGIDYVVMDETSGREFTGVVTFPLPTNAVEPVLADLRDAGLDENTYTVIVNAETVLSRRFKQLQDEYAKANDKEEEFIAREELQTKAEELSSGMWSYVVLTIVSAVIATAGLLLDSAATVVGSMVIAPLIGPAMSASVGTVVDDDELFRRGVRLQILGIVLSIASAAVFTALLRFGNLVPPGMNPLELSQVAERLAPNALVLAIAIGAGVAGVVSLMTGMGVALVGVMIAVALIPPAAAVGVGIAYGIPTLAIGASVFTLVNVISINVSALLVLWYAGYHPDEWIQANVVRSVLTKRVAYLGAALLVLSLFLGAVTYDSYVAAENEREIRSVVVDELETTDATLIELSINRGENIPTRAPDTVIVRVASPTGDLDPDLADRLDRRIEASIGEDVVVEVRVLQTQVST